MLLKLLVTFFHFIGRKLHALSVVDRLNGRKKKYGYKGTTVKVRRRLCCVTEYWPEKQKNEPLLLPSVVKGKQRTQ